MMTASREDGRGHATADSGAMRFFLEAASDDPMNSANRAAAVRNLGAYTEVAYRFGDASQAFTAYLYSVPPGERLVGASFGASLQPLRRLLFGPMTNAGRDQVVADFDVSRPTFMAAVRNGLVLDFDRGGLYTLKDPNDGESKVLLVAKVPKDTYASFITGQALDLYQDLLAVSFQVWWEASQPFDASIFSNSATDWGDAVGAAGRVFKWGIENADNIKTVIDIFS
jgi:hypothetical protein